MRISELIECLKVGMLHEGDLDVFVGAVVPGPEPHLSCQAVGAIMHDVEHGNMIIASRDAVTAAKQEHEKHGQTLGQVLVMTPKRSTPQ